MNKTRQQKIDDSLEETIEMKPDERPTHLSDTCGGDTELLRNLETLADADNRASDSFEQPADPNASTAQSKSFIDEQIDKYRLIDELGVGGMGSVYLAERSDGTFDQQVALKLIKRGMDSEAILQRFFTERQILASLQHPNIAHIIDGGTTADGRPFFVMELVDGGVTIQEFADREDLGLDDRLKLFCEVCSAVSFAHQNLIIHRDLKPSNIMVTKAGSPKLLDFGIAKLIRSEGGIDAAATQSFVFTPDYASPEQVRGDKLTTATDIYSLGVILYELVTGCRPYGTKSNTIRDIIRAVCETEPERPSTAVSRSSTVSKAKTTENKATGLTVHRNIAKPHALRGDLDNIILKCLRKEPERRYSSVEQLREDLNRHLTGLPVTATKDTWSYRVSKFVGRNRIGVAAAGLILLTMIGGLVTTLYQANKAQRRFNDVRKLANSFLFEFHDAIENLPGATPARELVVTRAVEYLDKLAAESGNDPELQRELAAAYARIGQIQGNTYYSNLGDTEGAMKSYQRSLEIRQKLVEAEPQNREIKIDLADSYEGVGDMLYTKNDLTGGLQSYENAMGIRDTIVAAEPDNLEYRFALAGVLGKRGDIKGMEGFPNLGDTPGALESYKRDVAIQEELVKAAPENKKYQVGYSTALQFFGMLQTVTGDSRGAIANGNLSRSILESLIAADPNNATYETNLMAALNFMRFPLLDEGQTAKATDDARLLVRTMEKIARNDPKNTFAKRSLSVSYNNLGTCLLRSGDAKGAIDNHNRSLTIIKEIVAADPGNTGNQRDVSLTEQYLAEAQLAAGEYDVALANLRQSVSFLDTELTADNPDVQIKDDLALCLVNIGKILSAKGDLNGSADAFLRALPLAEEVMQKTPFNVRFKTRHAASFFEAGKLFAKLAKTQNGEKAEASKLKSCESLKRSFDIWNEMRLAGTLSSIYAGRADEVAKELANCRP